MRAFENLWRNLLVNMHLRTSEARLDSSAFLTNTQRHSHVNETRIQHQCTNIFVHLEPTFFEKIYRRLNYCLIAFIILQK